MLKFEVLYWLVVGVTAFFSFSLHGLLLAAFGNIYIRDYISLARGITVVWFVMVAAPLFSDPSTMEKVLGTLGLVAALVLLFLSLTKIEQPRPAGPLVVAYSGLVLAVALFMVWSDLAFQKLVWLPVVIFLALSVYSLLIDKGNRSNT